MRSELHEQNLITDEEYAWLSGGSPMATDPKGGSPSPRRLEDYDALRARLTAAEKALECVDHNLITNDGDVYTRCLFTDTEVKLIREAVAALKP